ncbi:MAG: alpha/beta hydrolase [Rhodospirillaceae bacterium]|nr:alpha/beta hydrolase [Rhodospirillaceae bacterium]OUT78938.1 MAG: hypothetical protein CBB83_04615 [Rhodospirillaceae bacterium TMED23]
MLEYIQVNKAKLECQHIRIPGQEARPTLVFLHEGLGCVALWKDFPLKLCNALKLNGFIYSRQGYGASDQIILPRKIDFMHREAFDTVSSVLDVANINSAILIGHSDGGSIALIHAGGIQDDRVKAISTIAAHVFTEELTVKSSKAAKNAFENENLRTRLAKYHGDNVDCAFRGWNDIWLSPDFLNWNIEEFLPKIKIPTLAIQGSNDQYGTINQITAIEKGLQCTKQIKIIQDAQHSPHLNNQRTTLKILEEFFIEKLNI